MDKDIENAMGWKKPTISINYNLPSLSCTRCGHTWIPRTSKPPKVCPKCKNPNWSKPK